MTGGQPHSDPVLTKDIWQTLFNQAHMFATRYINRLRWRGSFGGVMPDGFDAESIAAEAVVQLIQRRSVILAAHRYSLSSGERVR